ncbi:MAG TPA: hypothetical protein VIX17_29270 [Pyrinomonadaceae bacterium]
MAYNLSREVGRALYPVTASIEGAKEFFTWNPELGQSPRKG